MQDTQPQFLQATRLGAAAPFRPDSPRSRADKPQRSSSQHWNQYPPRTAETRRWRPSQPDCCHCHQQPPQRCPRAAQRDVCTALRTPLNRKQVAFYGVPDSSGIGGGDAAQATGPAREYRRRQRQQAAAAAANRGGSLARCLSAALSRMQAVAARFGKRNAAPTRPSESTTTRATWGSVMAIVSTAGGESHRSRDCGIDPRPAPRLVAARRTRLGPDTTARGQEQAARPSPTRIPAPTGPATHAHRRQHTPVRQRRGPAPGRSRNNKSLYQDPPRRVRADQNTRRCEASRPATESANCAGTAPRPNKNGPVARDAVAERPYRGTVTRKH
ncbi:hypothetical protein MY3296_001197 [Beauveria thailandica]